MSLEYLIPISKPHAIQSAIFALEWQGELSDQALTNIQNLSNSLKSDFPEALVQKTLRINLGVEPNKPPEKHSENDMLGGMSFIRKGKFGDVVSNLNVSRTNCVVVIREYDRWIPTIEAVMRYFGILLPVIMKEISINVIALQYTDVFTWKDEPENLNLGEVFSENSPFIAPNVLSQKSLWHCHHGYWIHEFDDLDGNCLDNINIDTVDDSNDRAIHITTSHKFVLNNPLRFSTSNYLGSIESIQQKLHLHNKEILKKLLSREVCEKINLTNSEGV